MALERIDRALERIELSWTPPSRTDKALEVRHERLKDEVAQTLQEIDTLLAGTKNA